VSTGFQLVQALDWLASEGVSVINMSLAGPANDVLHRAIEFALDEGIVLVAAAGNNGPASDPRFPAAYPGVIAVTAIDQNNRAYLRAVRGDHLDFSAPGVNVRVADIGGAPSFRMASGTSFAAPFVAALVLHYRSKFPDTDFEALLQTMSTDVIDLGIPGHDPIYGWGMAGASLMQVGEQERRD